MKKIALLNIIIVCFCLTGFGQKEKLFLGIDYIPAMTTEFNSPATAPNIFRFSSSFGVNLYYKFKYSPLYLESGFYSIDRGYGYTVKAINANGELFGKYRKKNAQLEMTTYISELSEARSCNKSHKRRCLS